MSGEDIDVTLTRELEVEWRLTLSASNLPGRDAPRINGRGLDYEIHSVLQTLATIQTLLARQALLGLYSTTTPRTDQRLSIIQTASKHLTTASSIHLYLIQRMHSYNDLPTFPAAAIDVSASVQGALAELSHAEATLLFVLKDDPYPALLIQSRNKNDREWMIKAPDIPKTRAGLFARLCLSAAERAGKAASGLKAEGGKVNGDLVRYCEDLRKVGRAKACRFFGVATEMEGKTGEGIAWLRGGMAEVGIELPKEGKGSGGLSKLKSGWNERKEDKRLEKGKADWGLDAGKGEEGRVLEWLEKKWVKMNENFNVQTVPDWKALLAQMPSGRDPLPTKVWVPDALGEDDVARMRAPPELGEGEGGVDSSDEDNADGSSNATGSARDPIGAFPGTSTEYGSKEGSDYY